MNKTCINSYGMYKTLLKNSHCKCVNVYLSKFNYDSSSNPHIISKKLIIYHLLFLF